MTQKKPTTVKETGRIYPPGCPMTSVEVELTGCDGNVFAIIGRVVKALRRGGEQELAEDFQRRATRQHSYDDVIRLCFEYVEVS